MGRSHPPAPREHVRIPNVSPSFEPRWEAIGHMRTAVDLLAPPIADAGNTLRPTTAARPVFRLPTTLDAKATGERVTACVARALGKPRHG